MTEMKVAHTPGLWHARQAGTVFEVVVDARSGGQTLIAQVPMFGERNYANAHLIAAAPDLLEVAKAISERFNTDDRLGGLGDWLADVIAKAEGSAVQA